MVIVEKSHCTYKGKFNEGIHWDLWIHASFDVV